MTIKRRLFFSNIRMVLVTIGGFLLAFLTTRIVMSIILGTWEIRDRYDIESHRNPAWGSLIILVSFVVFAGFICVINSILTYKMTKRITRPLETLSRGVRQIHENNFAHRIEYYNNDEFRPVCEAFNEMAEQLQASTRRRLKDEANRRELLAGISHDLRTPLTTIKGYLEGLETGVASTPEMREKYFLAIKNKADSLEHIIERMFLFSKLDMDEFPMAPSRVDIIRAITEIIEELTEEYANRGLFITAADSLKSAFVSLDIMFFRNAIINILENSVAYKVKEKGHMEISFAINSGVIPGGSLTDNSILIRFADDGPGVSPGTLPNLFNAFYRTDPSRHTKGSGLGLAISAKIIERSGGTIYAENNEPCGLATVIRLPMETETE